MVHSLQLLKESESKQPREAVQEHFGMNGKMIYLKISIESVSGEISIVATHGVYGDGIIKGILEC